ncbi:hypothetical protein K3495_g12111 [Podosphaera aphanis]|nr:hypothetical protein K3495_g12111 [Podosphaera aphanis]
MIKKKTNFAIDWAWKNLAEASPEETTIPSLWLNNYERACTAAQILVDNLPQLKVEKIDKTTSNSSETKSENRSDIPQPVKIMSENTSDKETSSQDVTAGPMTAQQIDALVCSIVQNLNINNAQSQKSLRLQDIGYFLPDNDAKEEVEFIDSKTVYHNVFNFTARLKAKVTQGEAGPCLFASIAQKLDQCLKGKAELWYTTEISDTTRGGLKCGHHLWCDELKARFRMAPGEALRNLHALRYRVEEVRARKDSEAFVQKVITYGISSGTATTVYSQLLAHQILDGRLHLNVPV